MNVAKLSEEVEERAGQPQPKWQCTAKALHIVILKLFTMGEMKIVLQIMIIQCQFALSCLLRISCVIAMLDCDLLNAHEKVLFLYFCICH